MRLRAVWSCVWFGIRPWWMYEETPHYAPWGYWRHLGHNISYAWSWITFRETEADRAFEREVNS